MLEAPTRVVVNERTGTVVVGGTSRAGQSRSFKETCRSRSSR